VTGTGCGATPNCHEGAAAAEDPLADLPVPSDPDPANPCQNATAPATISAGKYCNWNVGGSTLNLNPGNYYVTGAITGNNGATLLGSGVFIYLAPGASFTFDKNSVVMNLSAPTSGTYKGVLFFQDRTNTNPIEFGKNSGDLTLSGAVYAKAANITTGKNNGGVANDCSLFIAKSLSMKNNGDFANTCAAFGGSPLTTTALAD
jgi:hypothetical protein